MREIKAVIQPFMLDAVLHALAAIPDLPGLTIWDVKGWGKGGARGASEAGHTGSHHLAPKTMVAVVVPDELAARVVDAIVTSAHTGRLGDGKVFIVPVEDTVKVRTGEHDRDSP